MRMRFTEAERGMLRDALGPEDPLGPRLAPERGDDVELDLDPAAAAHLCEAVAAAFFARLTSGSADAADIAAHHALRRKLAILPRAEGHPPERCSGCGAWKAWDPRYRECLCDACFDTTTDAEGRAVRFANDGALGTGCVGYYVDTKAPYASTTCFVRGIEHEAQEARFGGIVIIPRASRR